MAYGAIGGILAALAWLGLLALWAGAEGRAGLLAANAAGATFVRWLQHAAPQAWENFYWDATLGGVLLVLALGLLGGALCAGFVERLPDDHPLAWGLVWGLATWAATRWLFAPSLDPVLLRAYSDWALLAACLAFGLVIGAWLQAGRLAAGGRTIGADLA